MEQGIRQIVKNFVFSVGTPVLVIDTIFHISVVFGQCQRIGGFYGVEIGVREI